MAGSDGSISGSQTDAERLCGSTLKLTTDRADRRDVTTSAPQCVQVIHDGKGYRQCRRRATHYLPSRPEITTCTQHSRPYDVPLRGATR